MQYFGFDRPSFGIKTYGFGANFDPLDLFKDSKQGVWYDPSDKSTLFQDVEGTVPVTTDGDPVALIKDKSGNDNHAVQSVSTARPVYKTDGVLHWLELDGVDDYFDIINPMFVSHPITAISGYQTNTNGGAVFGSSPESATQDIWSGIRLAGSYLLSFGTLMDTGTHATTAVIRHDSINGTNSSISINKTSLVTGNAGTSHDIRRLFATTTPLGAIRFSFKGRFFGCIFREGLVVAGQIAKVEQYLAAKAGVTL